MAKFKGHLHNHTDISARDSAASIEKSLKKAKELGYKAYAVTDHASIAGWVLADMASKKLNIKVIYGVEAYEAERKANQKEAGIDDGRYHSLFIAKNKAGIKAIRELVTYAYKRENTYYKPRYDLEYLKANKDKFKNNVIWLSACIQGRLPKLLVAGKEQQALKYIKTMEDVFGKENIFIELQDHGIMEEKIAQGLLIKFAKQHHYQVVASNDVHYINRENYIAREILIARERGQTIQERRDSDDIIPPELYIKTPEEMDELFKHIPEALENTGKIIDMCDDIDLEEQNWHFPHFPIPDGYTDDTYMAKLVWDKLHEKYPVNIMSQKAYEELKKRVQSEIDVIAITNASAYMLIDSDFKLYAKEQGIRIGPGRGSACGSVVANVLEITDVDPLEYDLLMERFMNPERITMPDIDSDYQDDRRMEVIEYVVNKYGADRVAQILTFGTIGARMAIRDVGAVFDHDSQLVDKIAKMIPVIPGITIDKAFDENPEFKNFYDEDPVVKELIDNAKLIEGLIRQTGVHAAGVIISDEPLTEYGALMEVENSDIPVFFGDMKSVEYLKLLKMDFLGLRTLTVINDTVKMVYEDLGIQIDIDNLEFDDPEVFKYISTGETHGVFQLENGGMQGFMRELQPTTFEDIIAGISMYRPGPMDKIPEFLANKRDPSKIIYPKDAERLLKPILDVTYGIMVYQEQVMQIVRDLAGYTFGRSDLVRRGMAKKKGSILEKERYVFTYGEVKCPECGGTGKQHNGDNCILCKGEGAVASKVPCPFCEGKDDSCNKCSGEGYIESDGEVTVKGCIRNRISVETANKIYDEMIDFAKYAFNKSHATAYAVLGYQTGYLKRYYPKHYMTAYLNSVIGNQDKVKEYIGITKRMGIKILRPNINQCEGKFVQNDEGILMGLNALKYVGSNIQMVVNERKNNGEFKDLQNLVERVSLSKRELEVLIKSGTLDDFNIKRSQTLSSLSIVLKAAKKTRDARDVGQVSLFDFAPSLKEDSAAKFQYPNIEEYSPMELLSMEKEVSGFYLSGHPLELKEYEKFTSVSTITTIDSFDESDDRKKIKLVGIINFDPEKEGVRVSKKGNTYAVFNIEDKYSTLKVLAFKDAVEENRHLIQNGSIVEIDGKLSVEVKEYENNETGEVNQTIETKIFVDKIIPINELQNTKKVYVRINNKTSHLLNIIKQTVLKYPGPDQLLIFNENDGKLFEYKNPFGYCDGFRKEINKYLGEDNIAIR
ncbi:DNA polymerase III subunit alpha [Alkaliphilus sp. B6464]|uniref:DNA polymerase III subunit alpha n=1 Tax=Alkaliphilus sp. B6464 TaxID=2731219 RepID=UPI001BAA0679|nr:DNA polymerase III subunit alpha [Alkaliphilus sp. B6464]QUH22041.1 DNA polymerase III subunit alpha [Alkaliphilus sp. B6464]